MQENTWGRDFGVAALIVCASRVGAAWHPVREKPREFAQLPEPR